MKKTLYLLGILAIIVFPTLTFASFDTSLKYGSRGDAVSELQDFLTDQNVYTGKVDGKFGLGTFKAVKAFQTANSLSVDGYFGKASREAAQTLLAAELKTSDDAEVAETGNVSPAVVTMSGCTSTSGFSVTTGHPCNGSTPAPVSDTGTQTALNSLTQQVQTLTQQVQTQTQVQQQIATNTAPIVQQPVTPPAPVVPEVVTPEPYVAPVVNLKIVTSSSTISQKLVSTDDTPAISKVTFNISSSTSVGYLDTLVFSVGDNNTVKYIQLRDIRAYPVNGVVTLNNIGIYAPAFAGGQNFDMSIHYNNTGTDGVISGTQSKVTLTYYGPQISIDNLGTYVSMDIPSMILVDSLQ